MIASLEIKRLTSLSEITPENCIQTGGSKPLRVLCSDMNHYICKYHRDIGPANDLFNEFIASCFLKIWNIKAPECALVSIKREHVLQTGLPYHYFDMPCFGSLNYNGFKDVEAFMAKMLTKNQADDVLRDTFLKIAIFDIWLSNEDRHGHNYNMLFDYSSGLLIPFDHAAIFNGNSLDKDPIQITEDESILKSDLFIGVFSGILPTKISELRLSVIASFSDNVTRCQIQLPSILAAVPAEWRLEKAFLAERLSLYFTPGWIQAGIDSFNQYLQLSSNNFQK